SPDGTRLVSGSWDSTLRAWEVGTGKELLVLKGHTGSVSGVAYSPDGTLLASCAQPPAPAEGGPPPLQGGQPGEVKAWDARTGKELLPLKGDHPWLSGVAFSPDGSRLIGTSFVGNKIAWDVRSGELLSEVPVLPDQPNPALSPDGHYFARNENLDTV